MYRLLILLLLFSNTLFAQDNCSIKGVKLQGKVRIIESGADIKVCVKIAPTSASREITITTHTPMVCGEWLITDDASDFTIEITEYESVADLVITLYPNEQRQPFIDKYCIDLIHL